MNNTEYLQHFGVKGMKWGVRKKYYNKDGTLNTSGRQKQVKDTYKSERRAATSRAERKAAKNKYKNSIEKTYNKNYKPINRSYDAYNIGQKGANRINDKMNAGKSYVRARTEEYTKAMAKSMAITAGLLATPAIANRTINSVRKYANEKTIQKANASLARIGTFTYEKVAGDVYNRVMR